jgi:hypothetical protein
MVYQDYPDHLDLKVKQVYPACQVFQDQKALQVCLKVKLNHNKIILFLSGYRGEPGVFIFFNIYE